MKRFAFDALIRGNPEKIIVLFIDNLDLAAFTSVWFWVMLVLVWVVTSQYILGISFSDLQHAAKADPGAQRGSLNSAICAGAACVPPAVTSVRLGLALGAGSQWGFERWPPLDIEQ